jgi:tetratricopeptide (TPR) repeat protein
MKSYTLPTQSWAIAVALLIVSVVLAYSNIFGAEFTLDDNLTVFENPAIKTLWPPSSVQLHPSNNQYLNQILYVRPVAQFTFALNYALGGFTLWGYHAVSLAIHVCSTLLVFGILRRTLLTPLLVETYGEAALGIALAAALLWGVHPLDTNTITYISPRMEALMAMFYLATLYCWSRGALERSRLWMGLSVLSCFLGMTSKEVMITAPVMVFLYDVLFLGGSWRQVLQQRWRWYIGLLLSAALLVFLVLTVPGEHGAFISEATAANQRGAHSERWSYAATMPGVILYYLRLLVWPDPLVFDYKWPVAATWTAVVLPGIIVAGAVLATVWGFARRQAWAYPIAWYLITLSPSSSLMPLYDDYIAEYRVYLPSIGPVVFVVCGAWLVLRKFGEALPSRAAIGGCAGIALVCGLGGLTWARNIDYRTEISIWADTVAKAPNNERAHRVFADALRKQGRYDEAIKEYREALSLYPDDNQVHNNLGAAYRSQGKLEEAAAEFRGALQQNASDALAAFNLASVLEQLGRLDQASDAARNASVLFKQGKLPEAIQQCREAARLQPTAVAYNNLAVMLSLQGDRDGSLQALRQALAIDPNNAEARKNIGILTRGK